MRNFLDIGWGRQSPLAQCQMTYGLVQLHNVEVGDTWSIVVTIVHYGVFIGITLKNAVQ